jgi:lipopolysaccharide transport system ATP-binding protein
MSTVIRVENLGKKYLIRHQQSERYVALRDVIANKFKSFGKRLISLQPHSSNLHPPREEFWALKDVSFEVKQGDRVGIIGRNGAGKTTLLKLLSRITEPTTGRIKLKGRVASLLEVGTGFHPELTGRENIYLNGAILGMSKSDIKRKFDEIVDFAEIEKFLDTLVKRYSSGMYVRLAFAVAAHLEPEILLVDEVLAVGDARFQERCLSKMEDVGRNGRTVLFVSHNMPMVLRLTSRTVLLSEGKVLIDDISTNVIKRYSGTEHLCPASRTWPDFATAPGDDTVRLLSVTVKNSQGAECDTLDIRESIYLEMKYINLVEGSRVTAIFHLNNDSGTCLFATNDWNNKVWWNTPRKKGVVTVICEIPGNYLAEGRFYVLAAVATYNPEKVHVLQRDAVSFQIVDNSWGDGVRGVYAGGDWPGVVRPILNWSVHQAE